MASRITGLPKQGGGNYDAVPQSPQTAQEVLPQLERYQSGRSRTHSAGSSTEMLLDPSRPDENTSQAVFTGHIGGGFGPYAFQRAQELLQSVASPRFSEQPSTEKLLGPPQQTNTVDASNHLDSGDPDPDDALHNQNIVQDSEWTIWSARGWSNYITLITILLGLIMLFAGYPIFAHYRTIQLEKEQGPPFNIGDINRTGQVP